jgi:hypothetical protein
MRVRATHPAPAHADRRRTSVGVQEEPRPKSYLRDSMHALCRAAAYKGRRPEGNAPVPASGCNAPVPALSLESRSNESSIGRRPSSAARKAAAHVSSAFRAVARPQCFYISSLVWSGCSYFVCKA